MLRCVMYTLAQLRLIDVSSHENRTLRTAVMNGDISYVKFLVTLPGVREGINQCIPLSARFGYLDILIFLCDESSHIPDDVINDAIDSAYESGNFELADVVVQIARSKLPSRKYKNRDDLFCCFM